MDQSITLQLGSIKIQSERVDTPMKLFVKINFVKTHGEPHTLELLDPKDFIDTDGEWFKAAGDLTFMWPMLEMSGERFRYIEHGLYVYNEFNENSDFRKVPHEQLRIHEMLRQREPYKRLDSL